MKRKLVILCSVEDFFELHSRATEGRKDRTERQETVQWTVLVNGTEGAWTKKG
ncbi:hypothetical protein [Mariniflexile rhizosphaerae]|uniref:hypothetical protein n=1 Tax=unclassified Mariniflexile TaxID=2643887 RepID=UPI000CBE4E90|nr:hypothetical protein [Mariniflexile sp. TRM1-10]PLB18851.1 MAG: hypothetical protein TRG1_2365 [Flavobacteriaceae bacterium FS1-H7996/R]